MPSPRPLPYDVDDFQQNLNEVRRCVLDLYLRVDEARRGMGGVDDMAQYAVREANGRDAGSGGDLPGDAPHD